MFQKLISAVIAITIIGLVIVVIDQLLSWNGEGAVSNKRGATFNINLGYQPDYNKAESLALNSLANAVEEHPNERYFHIRWVDSLFLGWYSDIQIWLEYDRKTGNLIEAGNSPLINEPSEEWEGVSETLLLGLAKHGFQSHFLHDSGCHYSGGG